MKIIAQEPLRIGKLVSSFDPPQFVGCFVVKGTFRLRDGAAAVPSDEPDGVIGDVYADDDLAKPLTYPSDFVPKKPRVDVVVNGAAFAPGKRPVPQLDVAMQVGPIGKTLRVFGKRQWQQGMLVRSPGKPEPFAEQPIGYDVAVGGPSSKLNPAGMGVDGDDMPRVEDPKSLLTRPRAEAPAGFGAIPPSWPQRYGLVGSYRGNYLKERWPFYPNDFDYAYFNAAPPDQQANELKGNEYLVFENLHPQHSTYRSKLPDLRVRLFANVRTGDVLTLKEVVVKLDTVWIDVPKEKLILIWRGHLNVATPKMREIVHLLAWTEPRGEPAKPLAHYQALLDENETNAVEPAEAPEPSDAEDDAKFEAQFVAMDKEFAAAEAATKSLEAEAEKLVAGRAALAPPPGLAESLAALTAMPNLTPAQVADVNAMIAEAEAAEAEAAAMDAEFAKDFPAEATIDAILAGEAGPGPYLLDGADLAGRDLSKIDWRESSFIGANLAGVNFAGAVLAGAVFAKADVSGANFAAANLADADLSDVNLTGAKLGGANFVGAQLAKQNLAGMDLTDCNFAKADLAGADLTGAKLARVQLGGADLSKCKLQRADFSGADLTRADLGAVQAAGANFEGADLSHLAASASDFTGVNFRRVVAPKGVFEGAILDQADFSRAKLHGSLFGNASLLETKFDRADLVGAMFDDADARKAKFTNANLLRAGFDRTNLTEADLEGANAYEAGFWGAQTKDARLKGTNLRHTLLG